MPKIHFIDSGLACHRTPSPDCVSPGGRETRDQPFAKLL